MSLSVGRRFLLFIAFTMFLAPTIAEARNLTAKRICRDAIDDFVAGPLDPGTPGPFDILSTSYGGFDEHILLPDFDDPVEFHAEVTYPEELECGPFPIVFMMHGSHATCFEPVNGGVSQNWPCEAPDLPLPNHLGYQYFADLLASNGMVAVSISANSINANDPGNVEARARLFLRHIGYWTEANLLGTADYPTLFRDKIDLHRIGVMGHSRGGGGAARLVDLFEGGGSPADTIKAKGNSSDIKAVLLIAPTEGTAAENRVTETALGVILPYCDGDQEDMYGVKHYDASRYALAGDNGPKHSFEVTGANHNYYNTYWDPNIFTAGAVDDWFFGVSNDEGPYCQEGVLGDGSRLDSAAQQGTLLAIGGAFFRTYLRNEKAFRPFLRSEAAPPPSAMTDGIFVAYHPKDEAGARLDLNRLTDPSEDAVNTLGGAVTHQDMERFDFCEGEVVGEAYGCLTDGSVIATIGNAPHFFDIDPANQLRLAWNRRVGRELAPMIANEVPEGYRDVSRFKAVQFRAFVDFSDPLNPVDMAQDFSILLRDGAGMTSSVVASTHTRSLFFPPSSDVDNMDNLPIPRAILNTVRVRLSAFPGVSLNDIRSVELYFDQTETGAINITDLAFAD